MEGRYISIENIKGTTVLKSPETFTMRSDIYLLKSEKDILMKKMSEKGYVEIK